MRAVRNLLKRPVGRIIAGIGAAGALIVIIGLVAYTVWVYGGGAAPAGSSPEATLAPTLTPATGQTTYTLDPSASQATFTIHETLFGSPRTVVGATNQVAGEILINLNNPQQSQVGQIRIDVSALTADSDMRNRALQGRILETGDPANQYATFTATSYSGLPASITAGQTVTFKVTGNLTVHQVTKVEAFDVTLTEKSDKRVTGTATTVVRYEDFNLSIPNVPNVSDVTDNVTLSLNFTANAK